MHPRIGVVGTGWWATQHHIPSLLAYEGCDLAALADSDPARLEMASRHFGVDRTFNSAEEMFTSGEVDGVVIAVPHRDHYSIARSALDRGLHVLVEKPMTLRASQARDLVRLAADRDRELLVGFTYQYTAAARRCHDVVHNGEIGELVLVSGLFASAAEAHYRGDADAYRDAHGYTLTGPLSDTYSDPAVAGGGQAQTQLSHAAGMVMWVTGLRIDSVAAFMDPRDLAVDLVDAVSCRFTGGALATMASTGSLIPGQPGRMELRYYGTGGHIVQDLHTGCVEIHRNGQEVEAMSTGPGEAYPASRPARALADLVAGHGYNPAPALAGARAVELVEAAYRASALGRPVSSTELLEPEEADVGHAS